MDTPNIIHLEGGSEKDQTTGYNFGKLSNIFFWISAVKYCKKNDLCSEKQLLKLKKTNQKNLETSGKESFKKSLSGTCGYLSFPH